MDASRSGERAYKSKSDRMFYCKGCRLPFPIERVGVPATPPLSRHEPDRWLYVHEYLSSWRCPGCLAKPPPGQELAAGELAVASYRSIAHSSNVLDGSSASVHDLACMFTLPLLTLSSTGQKSLPSAPGTGHGASALDGEGPDSSSDAGWLSGDERHTAIQQQLEQMMREAGLTTDEVQAMLRQVSSSARGSRTASSSDPNTPPTPAAGQPAGSLITRKLAYKDHLKYAKYFMLLKIGQPVELVKQALRRDGLPEAIADKDPNAAVPGCRRVPAQNHPKYAHYYKMLDMGMSLGAVKFKVRYSRPHCG